MTLLRALLVWSACLLALGLPIAAAATSPLLQWRDPVYVSAGFAGIVAMGLLLVQPLLIGRYLPGLSTQLSRRLHRVVGTLLVVTVIFHVGALWITSPPDVVDVLLFRSPTPFSAFGAIAMWAIFGAAILAAFRGRLKISHKRWRLAHSAFVTIAVIYTVAHAALIEGTMETTTKFGLCALVLLATGKVLVDLRVFGLLKQSAITKRTGS